MKPTKLIILAATAAFVMNASAKPVSGYESVVLKATVVTESGGKFVKTKITSDDMLALIDNEFGTSYSKQNGGKGYQLVSYGLNEEEFAVLNKSGTVVLENASYDDDDYYLYIDPYVLDSWIDINPSGENYNFIIPGVQVRYRSDNEDDTFTVTGLITDKLNYTSDNESYSLKNGQGYIDFEVEGIYGPIMNASVSGSGKDVDPFDD